MQGIQRKRLFDRETLEEIVRMDNKKRYSFNEDKTLSRANQGHSIPVDVELPVPVEYLEKHKMVTIRYLEASDKEFWYRLDRHLPETEFGNKVETKRGYVIFEDDKPVGLLRYNLFWDNTPFCTMLFISQEHQRKGYGKLLLEYWEKDMKAI